MAKKVSTAVKKKAATGAKKGTGAKGGPSPKRTAAKVVRKPATRVTSRKAAAAPPPAVSPVVEDHLAIQQLLHKYCHAVDRGTLDEIADLFHRTAVLLPRYESDERYEGREAVRGWYARYIENFRSKVRYLRHKIESPVITITGNEATSVCYLDADSITASTDEPV
ncbi:MAG: nuclear transport factor 2 family protein, partial [Deltaproteobacteria bacterium]